MRADFRRRTARWARSWEPRTAGGVPGRSPPHAQGPAGHDLSPPGHRPLGARFIDLAGPARPDPQRRRADPRVDLTQFVSQRTPLTASPACTGGLPSTLARRASEVPERDSPRWRFGLACPPCDIPRYPRITQTGIANRKQPAAGSFSIRVIRVIRGPFLHALANLRLCRCLSLQSD